jgi:hypothetical protein
MRAWGADAGRWHFVISHEDGEQLCPEDRAEWVGYTASYKSYEGRHGAAIRIDGRWEKFTEAEQACADTLKRLRRPT